MDEMHSFDPSRKPVVRFIDGEAMAESRDVAVFFGKAHGDVLRSIDNLIAQEPSLGLRNFALYSYLKDLGDGGPERSYRCYRMNRDGFTLLAMGFTGGKALKFKLSYIAEFNAMEDELRRQKAGPAQIDVTDPAQLAAIALQLIGVNKQLEDRAKCAEAQVEADKPKTGFYDQFINSDGLYGLQNAARALGCRPNLFTRWLKEKFMFYQGSALVPRVQYIQMGVFEVKSTIVDDKARPQAYITPKGIEYLSTRVPDHIRMGNAA